MHSLGRHADVLEEALKVGGCLGVRLHEITYVIGKLWVIFFRLQIFCSRLILYDFSYSQLIQSLSNRVPRLSENSFGKSLVSAKVVPTNFRLKCSPLWTSHFASSVSNRINHLLCKFIH